MLEPKNPAMRTKIEMAFADYRTNENSGMPEPFVRNAFMSGAAAMASIIESHTTVNINSPRKRSIFEEVFGK